MESIIWWVTADLACVQPDLACTQANLGGSRGSEACAQRGRGLRGGLSARPAARHAPKAMTQVMATGRPPAQACPVSPRSTIPIRLSDDPREPSIEIDAARVARDLGLDLAAFRQLMADRKITVLCERGTGEDAGRWRATFYHGDRRLRLVVDAQGNVLTEG